MYVIQLHTRPGNYRLTKRNDCLIDSDLIWLRVSETRQGYVVFDLVDSLPIRRDELIAG